MTEYSPEFLNVMRPAEHEHRMREELREVTSRGVQMISHIDWTLRRAVLAAREYEAAYEMERAKTRPMRPHVMKEADVLPGPPYLGIYYTSAGRQQA